MAKAFFRNMNGVIAKLTSSLLLTGLAFCCIQSAFAETPFIISPDGQEVIDSRTGLIWQRCPIGMNWNAGIATCDGTPNYFMWYEALHAAINTARSEGLAWRIPNVKELSSIVDRTAINPAINAAIFPATPNHHFWSSTSYRLEAFYAWLVDFYDGAVFYSYLEDMGALRLVRDEQ